MLLALLWAPSSWAATVVYPGGAGGGGTDDQTAAEVSVDSTNLDGVGVEVQTVLEELEDQIDTKLPLAGGALTGALTLDEAGIIGTTDVSDQACAAGENKIFVTNDVWRKCQDGTISNLDTAGITTLDAAFDGGKEIDGANSLANAFRVGDGTTPGCIYTDATDGFLVRPCTASNIKTIVLTNFTWTLWDEEGAAAMETVDPDAASTLAMWSYPTAAYRPKKSIWFGAGSLSVDGTQCAAPAEVTINSGPKLWTIICTDNDASTIYGSVKMPDSWDGGTVTFTHSYIQTAADTGVLNGDIACQARSNGEVPSSTYGTEVALDDAAVVGSNSNDMITSAAATCAGTGLAGGDMLYFRYQLDATGTTTAVATLHHLGFNMEYSTLSRSD